MVTATSSCFHLPYKDLHFPEEVMFRLVQLSTQFVALHKDLQPTENEWPCMKPNHPYWLEAAKFIEQNAKGSHLRKCEYLLHFQY